MNPVVYGYLRVEHDVTAATLAEAQQRMCLFSSERGFTLTEIFTDRGWSENSGFSKLVDAAERGHIEIVVIQASTHLATLRSVQQAMADLLRERAGTKLLVMQSESDGTSIGEN